MPLGGQRARWLAYSPSAIGFKNINNIHKVDLIIIIKEGEMRGEFTKPAGMAIDVTGRVLVASKNPEHFVQIF